MLSAKLFMFCSGVAATLAWQYGAAAREIVANSYPQLGWLAPRATPIVIGLAAQAAPSPDQQQLNAISLDLDAMRQNVDRIAITQEQIRRNVDQLTAGQERMAREIGKLPAAEQQNGHKNTEPALRPTPTARATPFRGRRRLPAQV